MPWFLLVPRLDFWTRWSSRSIGHRWSGLSRSVWGKTKRPRERRVPTFDEGKSVEASAVVPFERSPNRRGPVRPNLLHEIYWPFTHQREARFHHHLSVSERFDCQGTRP